jgi:hypothetical protein
MKINNKLTSGVHIIKLRNSMISFHLSTMQMKVCSEIRLRHKSLLSAVDGKRYCLRACRPTWVSIPL